ARLEQFAEAELVDAGVVRDDGEPVHAGVAKREDEVLRDAAEAETAAHHGHAVAHDVGERGLGARINLADGHGGGIVQVRKSGQKPTPPPTTNAALRALGGGLYTPLS